MASSELFEGRWILETPLGEGGMGKVFKAQYASSDYPCAIKLLLSEHKGDPDIVGRFLNEAKIANKIGHPGVCRVIDVGWTQAENLPYLVMELLEGESVETILGQGHGFLTIGEALRITKQVLEVLAAAHQHGIVHRDIKPDNIFVTRDGSIKVLDFGIARIAGMQVTVAGSPMGTLGFMAPEVARGQVLQTGPKSDVWSVGATLFRLLTGELPHDFSKCQNSQEMLKHSATTPARSLSTLLPRCPSRLADVVERMLAFDPRARYSADDSLLGLGGVLIHPDVVGQTAHWVWNPGLAAVTTPTVTESDDQTEPIAELEIDRQYRSGAGLAQRSTGRPHLYVVGSTNEPTESTNAERRYEPAHDIEDMHQRIQRDPSAFDAYHQLVESYEMTGQHDAAIAISRTLRFLKQAKPNELALAEELDGTFQPPRSFISRKQWQDALFCGRGSARASELFARLWPVLAAEADVSLDSLGLSGATQREVSMEWRGVPRWVAYLSIVMDMPSPELHVREDADHGFRIAVRRSEHAVQPLLIAGQAALAVQPPAVRAFRIGRALARCHPYLIAARLGSAADLRGMLAGAVILTRPDVRIPDSLVPSATRWRDAIIKWVARDRVATLHGPVARVIELGQLDMATWIEDCEKAATRIGLLLCDDIGVAARIIAREVEEKNGNDRIRDMTTFSVSMAYLELRRSLKIG
jgi:serine/threonine protein kinase